MSLDIQRKCDTNSAWDIYPRFHPKPVGRKRKLTWKFPTPTLIGFTQKRTILTYSNPRYTLVEWYNKRLLPRYGTYGFWYAPGRMISHKELGPS